MPVSNKCRVKQEILLNKCLFSNILWGRGTLTEWSFNSETMASKRKVYLLVVKLQDIEVAEKTSKEAAARQFGMCMIDNNEKIEF